MHLNFQVVAILASKGKCERASIDEVYLDLTDAAKEMLLQAPPNSPDEIFMEAAKSNILGLPSVRMFFSQLVLLLSNLI